MNRRLTCLLLLTAVIAVLLVKVGLSLAQGSRGVFSQGTETCFVDPGTKCGHVDCSNFTYFANTVCNPSEVSQTRFLCDSNVPSGCTITRTTQCSDNRRTLSLAYSCPEPDSREGVITSETNICP